MQIAELYDTVKTIRRELHQIPEIGFDLPLTSEYVRQKLVSFGYEPISTAETGWVAVLKGKSPEAVAFRADMDALEVTEETGADFASLHPGKMHACGHDGHMALLLGFAKYLKSLPILEKSVVLVFQPAEEGPGGAKWIMDSGILQELQVEKIYGYHLYPSLPEGILGLAKGPLMARNGEFDITLEGVSSHAGQPHFGKDALIAAAQILLSVQNILARD
ncbi:M20 metallopeptidase family protein, partial [Trichococcus sp.]